MGHEDWMPEVGTVRKSRGERNVNEGMKMRKTGERKAQKRKEYAMIFAVNIRRGVGYGGQRLCYI